MAKDACTEGGNFPPSVCVSQMQKLIWEMAMKPGDLLTTTRPIRSQKTGVVLPRQGTFVGAIENLGRQLILVNFDKVGLEYLFPNEILAQSRGLTETLTTPYSHLR